MPSSLPQLGLIVRRAVHGKPTLIAFDLDGTLIDSRWDVAAAMNSALARLQHPQLEVEQIAAFVGDGGRSLCRRVAALLPGLDATLLYDTYLDAYAANPCSRNRWMPGATEILARLGADGRCVLGLLTNKPRRTTQAVLHALNLNAHFVATVAGGDSDADGKELALKPNAAPLEELVRRCQIDFQTVVLIGDGDQDVGCARAAGARAIAVRGGFCSDARLAAAQPDFLLDDLLELPDLLERCIFSA